MLALENLYQYEFERRLNCTESEILLHIHLEVKVTEKLPLENEF